MPIVGLLGVAAFSILSRMAMGCDGLTEVEGEGLTGVEGEEAGSGPWGKMGAPGGPSKEDKGGEGEEIEGVVEGRPKRQRLCTRAIVPTK